jgi:hypothetical protein
LEIKNTSSDGVYFATRIVVKTLFNHNGSKFTLSDSSSSFPDYDGDGLNDDVDPYPLLAREPQTSYMIALSQPTIGDLMNGKRTFNITATNNISTEQDAVIIAALYRDNMVMTISTTSKHFIPNELYNASFELPIPQNLMNYEIRLFVWDSVSQLKPLSSISKLSVQ